MLSITHKSPSTEKCAAKQQDTENNRKMLQRKSLLTQ